MFEAKNGGTSFRGNAPSIFMSTLWTFPVRSIMLNVLHCMCQLFSVCVCRAYHLGCSDIVLPNADDDHTSTLAVPVRKYMYMYWVGF